MKSPHRSATRSSTALLLTCLALGACSTPPGSRPLPLEQLPVDTGTVVATKGDTITVLINQQLVTIRVQGFADEGARVAAAVRSSPAHARFRSDADAAVTAR